MPKKKAPRNAFSFYLDDAIQELQSAGHNVYSKKDAVPLVYDKWRDLPEEEKYKYQMMADRWKMEKRCQPRGGRLDCTGMPIDNRVNLDVLIAKKRQEQRAMIKKNWATRFDVVTDTFCFLSFQSYFEFPNEEGYQPCEVACVKYNMKDGILKEWHAFINPGPLKCGLGAEAKIFSDKTHQIPLYDFEEARTDYLKMWDELTTFVENDDKTIPPIYCKGVEMQKTIFCLNYVSQLAGMSNRLVNVFYTEDLIKELFLKVNETPPSEGVIDDSMSCSKNDYEENTKCDYHHEIERIHCALLTVKKTCFWLSGTFREFYDIELTEKHAPVQECLQYGTIAPDELPSLDYEATRHMSSLRHKNYDYVKSSVTSGFEAVPKNTDIRYRAGKSSETTADGDAFAMFADTEDFDVNNDFVPELRRPKNKDFLKPMTLTSRKKSGEKGVMAARFPGASGEDGS